MKHQKNTPSNRPDNTTSRDQNRMADKDGKQNTNQAEPMDHERGSLENQNSQEQNMALTARGSTRVPQPMGHESIGDDDLNEEMVNLDDEEDDSFDR